MAFNAFGFTTLSCIVMAGTCFAGDSMRARAQPGYTRSEVDAMADAIHEEWLNEIRQSATTRASKIFLSEGFDGDWSVATLEEWMQAYNGQILDPPWEFDISEPVVYDNSTVSNALRSVFHAKFKLDYAGLNSLTDDDYIREGNEFYNQSTNMIKRISKLVAPEIQGVSHATVLLVAHLEYEDDEYVCCLTRMSYTESPRDKHYGFGHIAFRKDKINNKYWETSDLSKSYIRSFLKIAGPPGKYNSKTSGSYQEMYDYYKGSDVPKHFYTFGE